MKEERLLLIIGGGDGVGKRGDLYYRKKHSTKKYAERLAEISSSFQLLTTEYPSDGIDAELLPLDIPPSSIWSQAGDTLSTIARDFILNFKRIIRLRKKKITMLIFLPGFFGYIYGLLALSVADKVVLYYGFDTEKILEKTRLTNPHRLVCYPIFDKILLSSADIVLYRDKETKARASSTSAKFVRSYPITGMSVEDMYKRTDTCQDEPVELLYVGSLSKRKGIGYLIDALETLCGTDDTPDLHLRIVGDGPLRESLAEEVHERGLTDVITFEGYISKKDELLASYRGADLFVLPTLGEGFPRVLTEAMSQGLPVVTTDAGEIGYRLSDEEVTFVSSEDPDALVDGIRTLLNDEERRQTQIAAGFSKATELLSHDAADQHASIIRDLWESSCDDASESDFGTETGGGSEP